MQCHGFPSTYPGVPYRDRVGRAPVRREWGRELERDYGIGGQGMFTPMTLLLTLRGQLSCSTISTMVSSGAVRKARRWPTRPYAACVALNAAAFPFAPASPLRAAGREWPAPKRVRRQQGWPDVPWLPGGAEQVLSVLQAARQAAWAVRHGRRHVRAPSFPCRRVRRGGWGSCRRSKRGRRHRRRTRRSCP